MVYDDHPDLQQAGLLHIQVASIPQELDAILQRLSEYVGEDMGDGVSAIGANMAEVEEDCYTRIILCSRHLCTYGLSDTQYISSGNMPTDFNESAVSNPFIDSGAARHRLS